MRRSRLLLLAVALLALAAFAVVATPHVLHRLTGSSSAAAAAPDTTPPPGAGVAVPDTGGAPGR